jgi:hypothetical protein
MKPVGKPDAGNPHVRFDERGGETGRANGTAPFLDSTFESRSLNQTMVPRILGSRLVKPEDDGATIRTGGSVNVNGGWYKIEILTRNGYSAERNRAAIILADLLTKYL